MRIRCLFASDLHGERGRYRAIFRAAVSEKPDAVFVGGDLLGIGADAGDFLTEYLFNPARKLRDQGARVFVIMGNDDPRIHERLLLEAHEEGILEYVSERTVQFGKMHVAGYPYIPPTPFRMKDWERYDVSRFVDPGCVSPEEGTRTVPADPHKVRFATIKDDLEKLAGNAPVGRTIFLFHTPPHGTKLDRAALDGKAYDHAPLDVHIGSIAVREFIERSSPFLTLHGHVHESARLTGAWRDVVGRTHAFSAAHDGGGLALVRFDTENLAAAARETLSAE